MLARTLAVSVSLWLVAGHRSVDATLVAPEDPATPAASKRHIGVHGIMDPAGIVGQIGQSLSHAGRVLGLPIVDTVADLVSSAFGHPAPSSPSRSPPNMAPQRPSWTRGDPGYLPGPGPGPRPGLGPEGGGGGALGGILRLIGLDSSKLGAIALNGIIFLAQLISSSLIGSPTSPYRGRGGSKDGPDVHQNSQGEDVRGDGAHQQDEDDEEEPEGSPLAWILDSPALKGSAALRTSQDPDLSERIIEDIQRRFPRVGGRRSREAAASGGGDGGADTSCIQLLVCQAAPFLRGMQRSLTPALAVNPADHPRKGDAGDDGQAANQGGTLRDEQQRQWRHLSPAQRMLAYMPSADEVLEHAEECRQRFAACKVAL